MMMMMKPKISSIRRAYFYVFIIVVMIFLTILIISWVMMMILPNKSKPPKQVGEHDHHHDRLGEVVMDPDDDPSPPTAPPSIDGSGYTLLDLYSTRFPTRFVDAFGVTHRPSGNGQTIAIVSNVMAIWSAENVVRALARSGITNKSPADIQSQVIQVDATIIDDPFDYLQYTDLTVPLSDGMTHQVQYTDVEDLSMYLETALQCLFSALPDIRVVVFYYGHAPEECPPDEEAAHELLEDVVEHLYGTIGGFPAFNILCNTLNIEDQSDQVLQSVHNNLQILRRQGIVVLTSMDEHAYFPGEDFEYQTVPTAFSTILRIGGLLRQTNSLPTVFPLSNGGYFNLDQVTYDDSSIPFIQVGYVTPTLPTVPEHDPDTFFVGTPDAAGFCNSLKVYLGTPVYQYRVVRSISIAACAYAIMIAMANEISNDTSWNYQSIFYQYSFYLFDYVDSGDNVIFRSSDYRVWNPCAGLGLLDGSRLATLLSNKYVLTGYPIQLRALSISEQMSYMNMYPLSPILDPANHPRPDEEWLYSQPAFGPQSIWSELFIRAVVTDPFTGEMKVAGMDEPNRIVRNGDTILITSSQSRSTPWVLGIDRSTGESPGRLCLVNYDVIPGSAIPPELVWVVTTSRRDDQYVRLFSGIRLSPYLSFPGGTRTVITAEYRNEQSPSIMTDENAFNTTFAFVPHVFHMIQYDYNDTSSTRQTEREFMIQNSYFVNVTNDSDFLSCGYSTADADIARQLCSNYSTIPFVKFVRTFDPVPQWLLIPVHNITYSTTVLNNGLTYGKYMLFNTRCQGYMFIDKTDNPRFRASLINVNTETAPASEDIYHWSIFHVRAVTMDGGGGDSNPVIFRPRSLPQYPYQQVNDFASRVWLTFESPYYSKNSMNFYRKFMSTTPEVIDEFTKIVHFTNTMPPARGENNSLNLFLIDPAMMAVVLQDIVLTPTFVTDQNRRFYNCALSALSPENNSYVGMTPYNRQDPRQKWESVPSNNVLTVAYTYDFMFRFPCLEFTGDAHEDFSHSFQLRNNGVADKFLVHCDEGNRWKPRLGDGCESGDGRSWVLYPNYFNSTPSSGITPSLSGNYFYMNTAYFVKSRSGILSCAIQAPHLPGMITQVTPRTLDGEYYASSFIVRKSNR